jgi:hypothetical protein
LKNIPGFLKLKTTQKSERINNMNKENKKNKNLRLLGFIIILICTSTLSSTSFGRCNTDEFLGRCAVRLGEFNYIQSFEAKASKRKMEESEFSYVFSKGSTYIMIACEDNQGKGKMIVSLYNRDHKFIASTYDEEKDKSYSELNYPCSATGLYYIKIAFKSSKSRCGMCILGFSKE